MLESLANLPYAEHVPPRNMSAIYAAAAIPFPMYYVLDVLKGSMNPLAIVMSAVADVAEGPLRATIYSLLMVTLSVAMIIAAGVGGLLSATVAGRVSVVIYAVNLLLITCALPGAPPTRHHLNTNAAPVPATRPAFAVPWIVAVQRGAACQIHGGGALYACGCDDRQERG